MSERRRWAWIPRALRSLIPGACALFAFVHEARSVEPAWEELVLPAGARLILAGNPQAEMSGLALYFPAGTSRTPDEPALAHLAPCLFLGSRLEGGAGDSSFEDYLKESGWRSTERTDLDGAGVFLAGPPGGFEKILRHCLSRLSHPDRWEDADLARAWQAHLGRLQAWSGNPEALLRSRMAALQFGTHPYRAGLGQEAEGSAPTPEALRAFMREHYQAGAVQILAAGALDPERFLADHLADLDALEGRAPEPPALAGLQPGAGRIELEGAAGGAQIILHFPGVAGADGDAPALALLAGVLQQLLQTDVVGAGLARSASAFYDYTALGPRPLEIQLRQFAPADSERVEARLARILERMRAAEFSEYQVITAKDALFQSMDAAGEKGKLPLGSDPAALMDWSWNVLRQTLYFNRWRDSFETRLLGTGKERIAAEARKSLVMEEATFGLLKPKEGLD